MNSYISNKRKMEKAVSVLNILFWILNFVFLEISLNMFLKIISAGTSSWFDEAAKEEVSKDPFFIQRTEMILKSMIGILMVIICFSVFTVVLIRNIQLKNMYTQIGVYVVIGYSKRMLFNICIIEVACDISIAFPVSILLSIMAWNKLSNIDIICSLLKLMDSGMLQNVVAYVLSAFFMMIVVSIHTIVFVNKSVKNGIRFMLGKGVV